jgi:predicted small secreted protein
VSPEELIMSSEKLLALALFLGVTAGVAGCNTVEGVGEDVQGAGEAVEDASQDVKEDIDDDEDDDDD